MVIPKHSHDSHTPENAEYKSRERRNHKDRHRIRQIPSEQVQSNQTLGLKLTSSSNPDAKKTIATPQLQTARRSRRASARKTNRYAAKHAQLRIGSWQKSNQFHAQSSFNYPDNDHRTSPQLHVNGKKLLAQSHRDTARWLPHSVEKSQTSHTWTLAQPPPLHRSPHQIPEPTQNLHHTRARSHTHTHTLSLSLSLPLRPPQSQNCPQTSPGACYQLRRAKPRCIHGRPSASNPRGPCLAQSPQPGPTRPAPGSGRGSDEQLLSVVRKRLCDGNGP